MAMPTDLKAFLFRSMREPFVWGEGDCALWAASWILLRTGTDPAGELRGSYHDRRGCYRIIRHYGNLLNLADEMAKRVNIFRTNSPAVGDVACGIPRNGVHTMMIVGEGGEMFLKDAPRGIARMAVPVLAAWAIPQSKTQLGR